VHGHWPFVVVLSAGLALRVLTEAAYHPALLYIDSAKYLVSSEGTAPEGYQVLLRLLDPIGGLALVAAVQHAFGLAMAIALYALLLRRGVPRWAATLAAAPVLLDAYQLQLEQTIMPDVLFETMIAVGLLLLLWPRRPGTARQPGTQGSPGPQGSRGQRSGSSRRAELSAGGRSRRARSCSAPPPPSARSAGSSSCPPSCSPCWPRPAADAGRPWPRWPRPASCCPSSAI
jgi:hypothetical protein